MDYMDDDIFQMNGITFGSPVNDILEKPDFTLEELLVEDQLLQEAKGSNDKLVEFLSSENVVSTLLDYVVTPPPPDSSDSRKYKYPYMSCEVICLELPGIINTIVNYSNGKYLLKLFSILDSDSPLDNYLAGYFEKILDMLFRKETDNVMKLINSGETTLFKKFLNNIDNYSIMQIVQRLMLPHIPFNGVKDQDDNGTTTGNGTSPTPPEAVCQWSSSEEYCSLLCSKMLDVNQPEVSAHISDLLITVVQLALPDSKVISNLCTDKCLDELLTASFPTRSTTYSDAISLSAISVLESLVSRLSESIGPESEQLPPEELLRLQELTTNCAQNVSTKLCQYLEDIYIQLSQLIQNRDPDIVFQSKTASVKLGYRGLQLVKLIESSTRLDIDELDKLLCQSNVISMIIDFMFYFQHNSILHLSAQRIVCNYIQNTDTKREAQEYILVKCRLVTRMIEFLNADTNSTSVLVAGSKSPLSGHLFQISQVLSNIVIAEEQRVDPLHTNVSTVTIAAMVPTQPQGDNMEVKAPVPSCITDILRNADILTTWNEFVISTLLPYLERQNSVAHCDPSQFNLSGPMNITNIDDFGTDKFGSWKDMETPNIDDMDELPSKSSFDVDPFLSVNDNTAFADFAAFTTFATYATSDPIIDSTMTHSVFGSTAAVSSVLSINAIEDPFGDDNSLPFDTTNTTTSSSSSTAAVTAAVVGNPIFVSDDFDPFDTLIPTFSTLGMVTTQNATTTSSSALSTDIHTPTDIFTVDAFADGNIDDIFGSTAAAVSVLASDVDNNTTNENQLSQKEVHSKS